MTMPHEELRTLKYAREFLRELLNPKLTPRVPKAIRQRASSLLRHYPWDLHLEARYADDVCEHGEPRIFCRECKEVV